MVAELLKEIDENLILNIYNNSQYTTAEAGNVLFGKFPIAVKSFDNIDMMKCLLIGATSPSVLFILGFLVGLEYYETKELEALDAKP